MNVYTISTLAKPPDSDFPHYVDLAVHERDASWFGKRYSHDFNGRPLLRKWKPVQLYIRNPRRPRPDFYNFGIAKFVCNERARQLAEVPLAESGELLPVSIEGEAENFCLFNVTTCVNAVDQERSVWEYYGPKGEYRTLRKPAFIPERLGDEYLFKIQEDAGTEIYCLERSGDPAENEFKALVEYHGLTGLEFKLIWSDQPNSPL
ncbi:MAG TPA: hypothetical protein VEC99_03610 [Clostridia bacterium]|nr:hypothetical protein [Clostridia bacterium]